MSSDVGLGILLAIAPESNKALFLGPSIKSHAITLGVGAVARQREAEGNSKLKVDGAVTLSLDLSQLIGGKKNIRTIPLKASAIGGSSSDAIAEDLFGLNVEIKLDPGLNPEDFKQAFVTFRRTKKFDAAGTSAALDKPTDGRESVYSVPSDPASRRVVQRGMYVIEAHLPEKHALHGSAGEISSTIEIPIGTRGQFTAQTLKFTVKKMP